MNLPTKETRFAPGTMFVYNGEQYLLVREFHNEYGLIQISTGTPVGSKVCTVDPDVTAQQVFDMCTADMRHKIEVYDKYVR